MTVVEAGKNLALLLNEIYDKREALNIADVVMEKLTGLTKTQRLIDKQLLLTSEQEDQLLYFTKELLSHKPVQYVLQESWFAGMKFYVDEHVLIPRPETDELVETMMADLKGQKNAILDIGTGSGCIAIALKKKLPTSKVYALDISDKALEVAKKNACLNNVDIQFLQANILEINSTVPFPAFDVIVSNPPYIKRSESQKMLPNVLLHEPNAALFVPDNDALVFYRAIADFAVKHFINNQGKLFFEINENSGPEVSSLLKEKGFSEITIKKDMQGKDRIVTAVL